MKTRTAVKTLFVVDILRAMIFSGILVGAYCGISVVLVHKLDEVILPGTYIRVDYYANRAVIVGCIVVGVTICAADILMALSLDHILGKNLRLACGRWIKVAGATLILRIAFYTYVWKNEISLGLDRMNVFTPRADRILRALFLAGMVYEVVKVVQLVVGFALKRELEQNEVARKRINVKQAGEFKKH